MIITENMNDNIINLEEKVEHLENEMTLVNETLTKYENFFSQLQIKLGVKLDEEI